MKSNFNFNFLFLTGYFQITRLQYIFKLQDYRIFSNYKITGYFQITRLPDIFKLQDYRIFSNYKITSKQREASPFFQVYVYSSKVVFIVLLNTRRLYVIKNFRLCNADNDNPFLIHFNQNLGLLGSEAKKKITPIDLFLNFIFTDWWDG